MHRKLADVLGPEDAAALIEEMSSSAPADVATKADIGRLGARFDAMEGRFDAMEGRFDAMEARFDAMEGRFDAMEARFDKRFEAVDARLQAQADATHELALTMERELRHVYREIAAHTRSIVFACVGSIMTAGGLAFAFGTAT